MRKLLLMCLFFPLSAGMAADGQIMSVSGADMQRCVSSCARSYAKPVEQASQKADRTQAEINAMCGMMAIAAYETIVYNRISVIIDGTKWCLRTGDGVMSEFCNGNEVVVGDARCTDISGNNSGNNKEYATRNDPGGFDKGTNCWCHAIKFSGADCSRSNLNWVFVGSVNVSVGCQNVCSFTCLKRLEEKKASFLDALFSTEAIRR
ncbi:MAG: hypothetical protein LBL21_03505 [Rickettsiales bacterium]|nr:hypothetical protein [Rickettsiales bacterium]